MRTSLCPSLRKLRHRRRLVLVDAQVVHEGVAFPWVGHLAAIEVDLEAEAVFALVQSTPHAAAQLFSIYSGFFFWHSPLGVPVLAGVVLTKWVRRGGERERCEYRHGPRHCFVFGWWLRRRLDLLSSSCDAFASCYLWAVQSFRS